MNHEVMSDTEETERWNRIAMHVREACAAVLRDGKEILVKFDGGRDNGKIYTVVVDLTHEGASRMDSSNLEDVLSTMLGADISDAAVSDDGFVEPLRRFDFLARRGFIIGVRIQRDGALLNFEIFLTRDDRQFEGMVRHDHVFAKVAAEIIQRAEEAL